jgi:hypothetical protein
MTSTALGALAALVRHLLRGDGAASLDHDALPAPLVRRHLLAPLAFRAGATQFRRDHIASSIQAERRAAVLLEVLAAFGREDIRPILLKGAAYAGTLYPDPADRPMSDIDLLVPARAVARAEACLRRLGYWHVGGAHQRSPRHHAITYKRRGSSIDLHRHMAQAGRTRIDIDAIWREAVPSQVPGALRPSTDHEWLLHIAHLGRHELSVPMINFVDLARLGPGNSALATAWGLRRAAAAADLMLSQLRDGGLGRSFWRPSMSEMLEARIPPRWVQVLRKLGYIDDLSGAMGLVRTTIAARLTRT